MQLVDILTTSNDHNQTKLHPFSFGRATGYMINFTKPVAFISVSVCGDRMKIADSRQHLANCGQRRVADDS